MNQSLRSQAGVTLIEVLVAMVVTAIGLLGMVALQTRAYAVESESYQRSQATILLNDMENRLRANLANATDYVADDIGAGAEESCDAAVTVAERDLCEWANLLRGATETNEGSSVGAMTAARACIRTPETDLYVITVIWQGAVETQAPGSDCSKDEYGSENEDIRRALSTVVLAATLE